METADQQPVMPEFNPQRPAALLTPDAVLAEQLAQCHAAVRGCFAYCSESFVRVPEQIEAMNVASRLVRVSVALAAALDKTPREFTHRVIVERPSMTDVTPPVPTPPKRKSKTIPGGREPKAPNMDAAIG